MSVPVIDLVTNGPDEELPLVHMRRQAGVVAGAFEYHATALVSGWHRHDVHEIELAVSGVAALRSRTSEYVLRPQHAAWIPAGEPHSTALEDVTTIAVFFDPDTFDLPRNGLAILPVPPVLREMIRYATRWPIHRATDDDEARAFFAALAGVVREQLAHASPLSLPLPDGDDVVADVIAHTLAHLGEVTASSVCAAVGISERTLRRRFPEEIGQTWSAYVQHARLQRAMAQLTVPGRSIVEIAIAVGFESASAFARAFRAWTGESPSHYRQRWMARP